MIKENKSQPSDLFFVVVIYNKRCEESITCKYLIDKKSLAINVIVIDNSTSNLNNKDYCEKNGWKYISMNGNAGLSKAYNRALEELNNTNGYVVWADDDSAFDDRYIYEVLNYINSFDNEYKVFAPLVYAGKKIYSPDRIGKDGFIERINNLNEVDEKRISAINSGLVVDLSVYKNYRYDSKMFLDYIDHDFCLYCLKNKIRIKLVEKAIIRQNSFFEGKPTKEQRKKRDSIYKRDFLNYVKRNELNIIKAYKMLLSRKVYQLFQSIEKG